MKKKDQENDTRHIGPMHRLTLPLSRPNMTKSVTAKYPNFSLFHKKTLNPAKNMEILNFLNLNDSLLVK